MPVYTEVKLVFDLALPILNDVIVVIITYVVGANVVGETVI